MSLPFPPLTAAFPRRKCAYFRSGRLPSGSSTVPESVPKYCRVWSTAASRAAGRGIRAAPQIPDAAAGCCRKRTTAAAGRTRCASCIRARACRACRHKERVLSALSAPSERARRSHAVDDTPPERAEIHIAARHHGAHALGEEKRLRVERQIAVVHPEIPGKTGNTGSPGSKLLSGKRLGGINAVAVVRAGEIALNRPSRY